MQMALAAIAKVFGAVTGGGASASGSAAGVAGSTAGAAGASAGGLLSGSGFLTTLKVLGQLGAGLAAAGQANAMADQADLQAGQEQLQGAQRQTQMKRELMKVLGDNAVTFASAGIDISAGIAQSAAADAKKRAAQELSIDRQDTDFRRAVQRMRASSYRSQAGSAVGGALLGALGTAANHALDIRAVG